MTLEEADKEVYYWAKGSAGSFMSALLAAFFKADKANFSRLTQAFPEIAVAFISWLNNEEEFIKRVEKGFKNEQCRRTNTRRSK